MCASMQQSACMKMLVGMCHQMMAVVGTAAGLSSRHLSQAVEVCHQIVAAASALDVVPAVADPELMAQTR